MCLPTPADDGRRANCIPSATPSIAHMRASGWPRERAGRERASVRAQQRWLGRRERGQVTTVLLTMIAGGEIPPFVAVVVPSRGT